MGMHSCVVNMTLLNMCSDFNFLTTIAGVSESLHHGTFKFSKFVLNVPLAGNECALKEVSLVPMGWEGVVTVSDKSTKLAVRALMREVEVLAMLSHPNVVHYLAAIELPHGISLFMEYVRGKIPLRQSYHFMMIMHCTTLIVLRARDHDITITST